MARGWEGEYPSSLCAPHWTSIELETLWNHFEFSCRYVFAGLQSSLLHSRAILSDASRYDIWEISISPACPLLPRRNHLSFDISGTSFYFIACNKISRKEDLCITGAYILNRLEIQHDINTLLGSSSDVHPRTMLAIQHVIKIYINRQTWNKWNNFWQFLATLDILIPKNPPFLPRVGWWLWKTARWNRCFL